jgi:hypothetical protein
MWIVQYYEENETKIHIVRKKAENRCFKNEIN